MRPGVCRKRSSRVLRESSGLREIGDSSPGELKRRTIKPKKRQQIPPEVAEVQEFFTLVFRGVPEGRVFCRKRCSGRSVTPKKEQRVPPEKMQHPPELGSSVTCAVVGRVVAGRRKGDFRQGPAGGR
ncbi:dihydropyrimidinase-related protein 2 [Striga asiatica]|uniref:Dihydropyrimidinase-related protein 2 n=1 Tax=Striga asiatica TaxID=4170 RepID=A0A5A7R0E6_STRAF|nr:dihydropyrimidinase-related protein 2 [Striga asiatica]